MPTEAKQTTVAELRRELEASSTLIVSTYRGLKVRDLSEIRRALRPNDISYRVVKNRLMKIAAKPVSTGLAPLLEGPTAIAFGRGEAGAVARAVLDAFRPFSRVLSVRGAVLGDRAIHAEDVVRLAGLPPRSVLLAEVAGTVVAPLASVAGLFDGSLRGLSAALGALIEDRSSAA